MHCFTFFPHNRLSDQIWPRLRKKSRSTKHHYLNKLDRAGATNVENKLQGHQSFGSWEEDFPSFFTIMGVAAILVMWSRPYEQTFVPPPHTGSISNLVSIGPAFQRRCHLKMLMMQRHMTGHCLTCKLSRSLPSFGSGELKREWGQFTLSFFLFLHKDICPIW